MRKTVRPKSDYLRQHAGLTASASNTAADGYEEELDDIESLPFDAEHDEDDRDPEPERRPYAEHAQVRRATRNRSSAREDKSRI